MTPGADTFFDVEARHYDAEHDAATIAGYTLRARNAASLELIGPGPGAVLDAGMGPGRLCAELERRGWTVSGVDRSVAMVGLARARLPSARERLHCGRIEAIPFESEAFDVVVANGVLEYADDAAEAVAELARVLRPGGLALLGIANATAPYVLWRGLVFYPAAGVAKRLLRAGRAAPARRAPIPGRRIEELLARAGLFVRDRRYVAMLVLFSPLDELFPTATVGLARRLEARAAWLGRLLAIQMVVSARKL